MTSTARRSRRPASPSEDKAALRAALAARAEEILLAFDAEVVMEPSGDLVGGCPVHGGDNRTGFRVYPSGQWRCWTHQCHETFGGDPMGLVWGLLVARDGVDPGYPGAMAYCRKMLGGIPTAEGAALEEGRFMSESRRLALAPRPQAYSFPVTQVAARLRTPSPYFVDRGYPPDLLDAFYVGEPLEDRPGPMRGRAVVPLLAELGNVVVGFSGRMIRECDWNVVPKWFHQPEGLLRGDLLYGWHMAEAAIRQTGVVHLVEGCPDVWAWHARGKPNTVGMFGTTLTDAQLVLLEQSGALDVVLCQDDDEAGHDGAGASRKRLEAAFRVSRRLPPAGKKDWGEAFEQRLTWD